MKTKFTRHLSMLVYVFLIVSNHEAKCNPDTIKVNTTISNVTVFFKGAEIKRSAEMNFLKGRHILVLENLPYEINSQSIQVDAIPGVKILSVKQKLNQSKESYKSEDTKILEKKVKSKETLIKQILSRLKAFKKEEELLNENAKLGTKDYGTKTSEIKEAADFYRVRLNEINLETLKLSEEIDVVKDTIQNLYMLLNEQASKERKATSELFISIECDKPVSKNLAVSYYVESSGWEPTYDFRVDDVDKPLTIVYNANVYQTTGEDWKNVAIKLSSNNPSLTGSKPELSSWYLGRRNEAQRQKFTDGNGAIQGKVFDAKTKEPLPFASVIISRDNQIIMRVSTDVDGNYMIRPLKSGNYSLKVNYLGYIQSQAQNVTVSADKITFYDFNLTPNFIALKEVEIADYKTPLIDRGNASTAKTITAEDIKATPSGDIRTLAATTAGVTKKRYNEDMNIRGSRSDETDFYIDGIMKAKKDEAQFSNYISNSLKTNVINVEYDIEIPYTINSDGSDYAIKIKEAVVPAEYVFYAIPKLDNDAFLTANISTWNELNLLSGKSGIYYQGTFTGETYLNIKETGDTLQVSLGRDKNIIIKREGKKELNDKRLIGNNFKETTGWEITVRNNKKTPVKIIVEDQYPLSERKSIEAALLESSNATIEAKTGKLTWNATIEPNDKRTFNFSFYVKYPKDISLNFE